MRISSPALYNTAGRATAVCMSLLFRTVRSTVQTGSVNPYDSGRTHRHLISVWHDAAAMAVFGAKHSGMAALTSRHRDGTFVASTLQMAGIRVVRGSTGKSGQRAARELLDVAQNSDIVITPDGPRGPRRKVSNGIVFLASHSGNSILPTGFACSRGWEIKGSWTTLTIPQPFSKVVTLIGEPIGVPAEVPRARLHDFAGTVQQAMEELQRQAYRKLRSVDRSELSPSQSTLTRVLT